MRPQSLKECTSIGKHMHEMKEDFHDFQKCLQILLCIKESLVMFATRARTGHTVTQEYLFRFNVSFASLYLMSGIMDEVTGTHPSTTHFTK